MMKINEKIRERRLELKMSLEDVAKIVGVNKSTILKYETGQTEKMPTQYLVPLAKALRCAPTYLMGLEDKQIIYDDYFPLHYCSNLSAGQLDEIINADPDAVVYVPIKYQSMKKRLKAFKVNGDSMNNVIKDKSVVIVEQTENIKNGSIVVAWIDGQATVKRFYRDQDKITLMPDSSDKSFLPIVLNDEQSLYIVGRVIHHINPDDIEKYY